MKTRAREDQVMIGYLLGMASELEQSQIETRYFREPHFYEEMLALEEEVICDYLNDTLTPLERRQFKQHFLATPRRYRKYQSTRKLLAFIADQGPTQAPLPPAPSNPGVLALSIRWANDFLSPRLGFLWTLTSVAVLTIGVWMLSIQVSAYRQRVEQQEARQATTQKTNAKTRAKPTKHRAEPSNQANPLAGFADQLQASLDDPPALLTDNSTPFATSILAATLRPSSLRSATAPHQIALPTSTATLRLHLLLGAPAAAQFISFNVVVKSLNGAVVARWHNLTPQVAKSAKSLHLDVPANRLVTSQYVVSTFGVTASKEIKAADEYFLHVTTK